MNLTMFLHELRRVGISLVRDGESLRVQGPKGALTSELREALTTHKQAILAYLQDPHADDGEQILCEPDPAALYEPFPLSDLQLGFYMADDPYMEFHVRPHYYTEKDRTDFDVERYEAAWNKALARHRHELVVVRPEGDLATLRELSPLKVRVYDLRQQPAEEVARVLEDVRQQMMRAELPIDAWPWLDLRVSLWRSEAGESRGRIHYNHNNFFSDGYGTARLLQEVELNYRDPHAVLPPIELSYRDAVTTLERLERSPRGAGARRYWEERLPTLPGPPELPQRAGMERRCRSRLARRERFLAASTWSGFKANARHFGLTPSNAVFAVYAEILAAWGNSRRFVISNMMTRRLNIHPHINEILGNFASLYPLEIDATGGTLATRAIRVQERVIEDAEHRALGGMQVMQALNRQQGGLGRAPVPFVVGSGLFMEGFERSDFSCLETSQVMLDHQFWELADGRCYYVWDVLEEFFPERMIDDMGAAYEALVERLAQDQAAWELEVLDVIPAHQLEARRAVAPADRPVASLRLEEPLAQAAARHPDDLVLSMPDSTLSYRELAERSDRLAGALVQAGVERGQAVAVVAHRGAALLTAVYAILKAGGAYVPIPPSLPDERRSYVLESSGARHVIADPRLAERLTWPQGSIVLTPDASSEPPERGLPRGEITDLAYVIYTSGSTGRPKGVMIDHRGAVNTILDVNERFAVGPGDRIFGVSSFGFDLSVYDIFGATASGATLVYPDPEQTLNPAHWLDRLEAERVSVWNSAPPLAVLLVEAAELRGAQLPELRLVMLSGDWIPVDLPDRIRAVAPNAKVVSLGGATEASIWSIAYEIDEVDPAWTSIPYGYPMLNQSWHVLDEWGRPAPEWTPGELYIGGIGLALGYMNDPEQTAKGFIPHPVTGERLYRTGDIGRYLPGGVIEFLGRRDSQVKLQGHRIELGEIETVLAGCPGVGSAVVVVDKPAGGSARLVAYVVPEPGATLDDAELQALLARKLPDYMVPRTLARLERLPLSSNGKVDRKALPAVGHERVAAAPTEPGREPLDAVEVELLAIWARVLKREGVGVFDDFFELGGHSFEAVRVVGLVRELLGASLSLGDIWEGRTVARLAERIRGGRDQPLRCLVAVKPEGSGTPLLLVHPAGGHVLCYRELAARLACPVLAFQAPGLDGHSTALESIAELARVYIQHLDESGPQGPVILGGWSSGGLIAHEMAVQLRALGRQVEGVVIVDSPAPLVHRPIADDVLFEWFLGDLGLEPTLQATAQALDRTGLSERQQLEQAAALMRRHAVDLGADIEQLVAIYQVFKGIVRASRVHHAHAVDTDLLIVRAQAGVVQEFEEHPFSDDADWGWRKLTRGAITTGAAEATHYTILRPPTVDVVAALIERWISRA